VVTLTKHKGWEKPEDEQLHVLPLYVMDSTDECGSKESQDKKIASGALEVLKKFPIDFKIRTTPLKPCKTRGRKPKDGFSPRKQALQTAFKQLIASGKLRRIEPPEVYQKCHAGNNRLFPMPTHHQNNSQSNNKDFMNSQQIFSNGYGSSVQSNVLMPSNSYKREETACKFYAGKHISHNSYSTTLNQVWMSQSQHDFNSASSVRNSQNPSANTMQGGCYHNSSSFSSNDASFSSNNNSSFSSNNNSFSSNNNLSFSSNNNSFSSNNNNSFSSNNNNSFSSNNNNSFSSN
ncbi:hypothetical protein NPIL_147841, partial [Nephila pilipes]